MTPTPAHDLPFDPSLVYLGGQWQRGHSAQTLSLMNPSEARELGRIARGSVGDIDAAVQAASAALRADEPGTWAQASAAERARCLVRIGALVRERIDELARLEALDTGKPLAAAHADVLALARSLEWHAGAAEQHAGHTLATAPGSTAFTRRVPRGVIGHLLPACDTPGMLGRSVAAALAMGNACVVKPAETACLSALAFAHIAHEAGLPAGAFNLVPGLGSEAGAALVAHAGVQHVAVAGSATVVRRVQEQAVRRGASVSLRIDGASPQLVFADADLDAAVAVLVAAGVRNAGQGGGQASRVLVQRAVHGALLERMAQRVRALRVGPALADLDLGPVISERRRDQVDGYLAFAQESGLRIVAQGRIERGRSEGWFVCPSLLAPSGNAAATLHDELIGPVQLLLPFDDEAEAVAGAHATPHAGAVGVWTRDGARQLRLAQALQIAQVSVNDGLSAAGVELPLGSSGAGLALDALDAHTTLRTVALSHG